MMILGSYTIPSGWRPEQYDIPKHEVISASQKTYTGVAYFSWGTEIVGKKIVLEWDFLPASVWNELETLYLADQQITWNVQQTGVSNFTVVITNLDGKFFETVHYDFAFYRSVKLELLILAELSGGS